MWKQFQGISYLTWPGIPFPAPGYPVIFLLLTRNHVRHPTRRSSHLIAVNISLIQHLANAYSLLQKEERNIVSQAANNDKYFVISVVLFWSDEISSNSIYHSVAIPCKNWRVRLIFPKIDFITSQSMGEKNESIHSWLLTRVYLIAVQTSLSQGWTKIIIPPQSHRRQPKTEREACPFSTRPTLRIIISRPLVNPARLESPKSKHQHGREQERSKEDGSRQLHLKLTPATTSSIITLCHVGFHRFHSQWKNQVNTWRAVWLY